MDENLNSPTHNTPNENGKASARTAEEIAWDEEFRTETAENRMADLRGIVRFALRLPGAFVEASGAIIPEETARHARASMREGFLAFRSLFGAISDRIEDVLADSAPETTLHSQPVVQGPPGTWGTGRSTGATSSPKVKRIDVSENEGGISPAPPSGDMP